MIWDILLEEGERSVHWAKRKYFLEWNEINILCENINIYKHPAIYHQMDPGVTPQKGGFGVPPL